MLLPCVSVIDVKPLLMHCFGRCYCQVADGKSHYRVVVLWQMLLPVADWKNHKVNYFNFSSEVLNRTSSQTCGRWYLPTFLFRDGSLTLMYRASFIVPHQIQVLPPNNVKVVNGNIVTSDVTVVIYGRRGFQMFLEPFSKSSCYH